MKRKVVPLALLGGAVAVAGTLPPVQARIKAAGVLAHALDKPWPRPFAHEVERSVVQMGGVDGDLYLPNGEAPPILLVHGAAPEGKDDRRLVRLARSFAAADRLIFVPDLDLKKRTLEEHDIERIVLSISALSKHPASTGPVQVVGVSYGGSFALIAAADERVRDDIEQVATFGAYFDLVGYIQAITTGTSIVDGRRVVWEDRKRAAEVLHEVSVQVVPKAARPQLRAALDNRLPPQELPQDTRAVYRFLTNDDPQRTLELKDHLPEDVQRMLARFSPSSMADRIRAPVIALHSRDDPAVPYGEALRLKGVLPDVRLLTVELFKHVDLEEGVLAALPDLIRGWRFTSWILSAQEELF